MSVVLGLIVIAVMARGLIALISDGSALWTKFSEYRKNRITHFVRPGVIVREVDLSTYVPGEQFAPPIRQENPPQYEEREDGIYIDNPEQYLDQISRRGGGSGEPVLVSNERDFRMAFGFPWLVIQGVVDHEPESKRAGDIFHVRPGAGGGWASRFEGKLVTWNGDRWLEFTIGIRAGDIFFVPDTGEIYVLTVSSGWSRVRNEDEVRSVIEERDFTARWTHQVQQEAIRRQNETRRRAAAENRRRAPNRRREIAAAEDDRRRHEFNQDGSINRAFLTQLLSVKKPDKKSKKEKETPEDIKRPARKLHIPGEVEETCPTKKE